LARDQAESRLHVTLPTFRTARSWGVGQRIFFLHDGRTANLVDAIKAHQSSGSKANQVIAKFNALLNAQARALIVFLRSL
jgi:CxxC motif-containing protein (DUF1111 family)